jgi:hypothetical protein
VRAGDIPDHALFDAAVGIGVFEPMDEFDHRLWYTVP